LENVLRVPTAQAKKGGNVSYQRRGFKSLVTQEQGIKGAYCLS